MMDNPKNIHSGHRARLRDRVRKESLDSFQEYQVLEYALSFVIPYKDTNPIAHALINRFGGLVGVFEANEEDIAEVSGMGEVSAHFLTSIISIYNYYAKCKSKHIERINNPADAVAVAKSCFPGKQIEEIYMISILGNNRIAKIEKISEGGPSEAKINIRKITDAMLRNKVDRIIITHNHPKGESNPSSHDDDFTRSLTLSLELNGCHLVDHIIIGEDSHYSYRVTGVIDVFKEQIKDKFGIKNFGVAKPQSKYGDFYD